MSGLRCAAARATRWLAAAGLASAVLPTLAAPATTCRPDPLAPRAPHLRGSFNQWGAPEALRFAWACHRWELVATLQGEHSFKLGDEAWSADMDLGAAPGAAAGPPWRLAVRGGNLRHRFNGSTQRYILTMDDPNAPELSTQPCITPPLGATRLYLRGSMNGFSAQEAQAFQFQCDAYYLNVDLRGSHDFRIADASGAQAWGAAAGTPQGLRENEPRPLDGGDAVLPLRHAFSGPHTLRMAWVAGRPQLAIGPRTFADPQAAQVLQPVAASARHDSRDLADKRPFGAVPAGTEVAFSLTALPGVQAATLVVERRTLSGNQDQLVYTEPARVPLAMQTEGPRQRWAGRHRFDSLGVYGYWFELQVDGATYSLQNNRDAIYWTRESGSNGAGVVQAGPLHVPSLRRFRLAVHAPGFSTPAWAADAVYYYLFPERFRNGDKANDPRPGRHRFQDNKPVEQHARWLDKPYRPGSGDGSDAHHSNDFFGGDLEGIIQKLDHIAALGVNTLYITPLFAASSNHKYDTADFHRIDPGFGSNADFERLTREAARRGLRVIPDASFNHVGRDALYFDRWAQHGGQGAFHGGKPNPASPYADWFIFDTTQTDPDRQVKGWVGVVDLPELNKASPSLRRFFYGAPDGVTQTWLKRGAAGWRMDVTPWVPDDFWREWRAAVKAQDPQAITIAETWFDSSKYLLGDMFDATMNYIFRNAVLDYAGGGSGAAAARTLEYVRELYPAPAFHALMNLVSGHDSPRALHVLGDHGPGTPAEAVALARRRFELALFFQLSYPGAPAIYYGDEVGMTGGEDPFNRAGYPWPDEGGAPDLGLQAQVQALLALRRQHAVLRRGTLLAPLHADEAVIVLARQHQGRWALSATNNSASAREVAVRLPDGLTPPAAATWGAATWRRQADGALLLQLPPLAGTLWLTEAP